MSDLNEAGTRARLYLITPPRIEPVAFGEALKAALDGGDVACLQIRLKDVDDDAIRRATDVLRPIAQDRDVAVLMNDRPDLAALTGCDGVHIGQQDAGYAEARRVVGADAVVGVTCHASRHLAMVAAEQGADYVAFGAFHSSGTKPPSHHAEPDLLAWWNEMMAVPSVAIGGITVGNCMPLLQAGADFLAVVAGVWDYPDGPGAAVRDFNKAFDRARGD